MDNFYDRLAPLYDLILLDWDASMEQQAVHLTAIIGERWGADVRIIEALDSSPSSRIALTFGSWRSLKPIGRSYCRKSPPDSRNVGLMRIFL
jgi:hypothetical protein